MAYIVDLVVIMHMVFMLNRPVTQEDIREVTNTFERQFKNVVHAEIRSFVSRRGVVRVFLNRDDVFDEIEELIRSHVRVVSPETGTEEEDS